MADEQDIARCFSRFYPAIRAKCARMLSDAEEASDVAQETFIRLWRELGDASDVRTTTAFIYKTSTRLAIDHLRQRKRRPRAELETLTSNTDDERALDVRQTLAELARVIPAEELELAILERVDRMSQLEIAAVLGCSDRQVRRLSQKLETRLSALKRRLDQ
jgi:RNA polymerase sigma-70 factor (ECF subfamily)